MTQDRVALASAAVADGSGLTRARRFTVIGSLYLVSDIGYSFFFGALTTILLQRGVALGQLALINLLGLLYFGRFFLGPLVDRLGGYRGWLMITQVLMVGVWLALVPLDPSADLILVLVITAIGLALSAVHDTAMNGLAVRLLPPEDRGIGNGIQTGAACLSIVIGSGGALFLYAHAGWGVTVGMLGAIFLFPLALLAPLRVPVIERPPRQPPFAELISMFRQPRVRSWVVLILPIFAAGGFLASALVVPMIVAAGWPTDRIALVQGTLSGPAGLIAALVIGALINRIGRRISAIVVGVVWTASIGLLLPLSMGGSSVILDIVAVLATVVGYAGAALCVYTVSMDLARPTAAATDLTLQVSVLGVLRLAITPISLALAGVVGFPPLIGISVVLTGLGTWVIARWLRQHPYSTSPLNQKEHQ